MKIEPFIDDFIASKNNIDCWISSNSEILSMVISHNDDIVHLHMVIEYMTIPLFLWRYYKAIHQW